MDSVEVREPFIIENGGEKIFGVLHRPLNLRRAPAVLICPGFAGNKCGKFRLFVRLGKELAKKGIAVLRFDYRGSGDSEGEFGDITLQSEVSDTLICLNGLARDAQIDPDRIGLLGRSLGGAIAVLAARNYPIKSLALWAPIFHSDPWRELWESLKSNSQLDSSKQEILRRLPAGAPNLEFLTQFFQLNLDVELEGLKHIPLLHIHGEHDGVVKNEHVQAYEKARMGLDNTRFIQLQKSDHDFSDPLEQAMAIQETCAWFQKTL